MDSAPGWRRGGGAPCCRVGGRRDGSGSPCRCRRSTEDPDGDGAASAGPPARARHRYPPLPREGPASPLRASGDDLDGQPDGPPADGTDRSEISVVRGGPQSFAPAAARDLAARGPAASTRVGSRDPRPARSLCGEGRRAAGGPSGLAPSGAGGWVSGGGLDVGAPPAPRRRHPRLPGGHFATPPAELPLSSVLLPVRARGGDSSRRAPGKLARRAAAGPLPSVPSGRVRSRPLTS
jgi:hypothetical protein